MQEARGYRFEDLVGEVYEAAKGENVLSGTFLRLAKEGLLFETMKQLVEALFRGGEREVRQCTGELLAVGATSGADLATGFFMTVREVDSWS